MIYKELVPENARPARSPPGVKGHTEVGDAGPVPVLRGLFCYYPLIFFFFFYLFHFLNYFPGSWGGWVAVCFVYLWFSPHPVFKWSSWFLVMIL